VQRSRHDSASAPLVLRAQVDEERSRALSAASSKAFGSPASPTSSVASISPAAPDARPARASAVS
jgi:hypothetical protein